MEDPWKMTAKDFEELERANVLLFESAKLTQKVLNRASERRRAADIRAHPERYPKGYK